MATPVSADAAARDLSRISRRGWQNAGRLRRWLITGYSPLLPLTVLSCLFGGTLALPWTPGEGGRLILVCLMLVLFHATGRLLSDQLEWRFGPGQDRCLPGRFGAHPLAQGFMDPLVHLTLLLFTGALALCAAVAVVDLLGAPAGWLAGIGVGLMMLDRGPLPFAGVGELAVFLVWGPLMVGGVYWAVSGDWGADIALLSVAFGLGPTVLALAERVDRRREDAARGRRTLPVLLGVVWSPRVVAMLGTVQMGLVVYWAVRTAGWAYLLVLVAVPALTSVLWVCLRVRPRVRPRGCSSSLWRVWYTSRALGYARAAGAALVAAGLISGLGIAGLG